MTTAVVIQARVGSTRLPGKVMLPLAGRPLLERMLERVAAAHSAFEIVVATTVDPRDEPIRELCRRLGVRCYDGHPTDLLDRHFQAARVIGANTVVKIPSDCPLIDPEVIDQVLGFAHRHADDYDFVSNLHPPSFPDGNDVEVVPLELLALAWREATRPFEREHTTPFLWDQPERFRVGNVRWDSGLDCSRSHRWTIDYPEDYALVLAVYDALWSPARPVFQLDEIIGFLDCHPEVGRLNARWKGSSWQRSHLDELRTVHQREGAR